jgi:sugar phosphate isomerase/epimerase
VDPAEFGLPTKDDDAITARTTLALAEQLGVPVTVFPSHHGGFASAEGPWPGRPVEFGARLAEVQAHT